MEGEKEFQRKWALLEKMLMDRFGRLPKLEAILYLIGINEYRGRMPKYKFSRAEKQDLIHVGTCTLLQQEGYFHLLKYDEDGWPKFVKIKEFSVNDSQEYENYIYSLMFQYFDIL